MRNSCQLASASVGIFVVRLLLYSVVLTNYNSVPRRIFSAGDSFFSPGLEAEQDDLPGTLRHVGPQSRSKALGRPSGCRSARIGRRAAERADAGLELAGGAAGPAMSVLEILLLVRVGAPLRESFLTNLSQKTPSGTPAVTGGEYRTRRGTLFPVREAGMAPASSPWLLPSATNS